MHLHLEAQIRHPYFDKTCLWTVVMKSMYENWPADLSSTK